MSHIDRYLRLLGVEAAVPGVAALSALVAAHLYRVPFETISKLHYRKHQGLHGLPPLPLYLDGIERHNFGGTCYANNYYFNALLNALGYTAHLCGADMASPDVHLVNIVRVEGREFLVDMGYGAPFDFPLPRDLPDDLAITSGRDRYVLHPQDEHGCSRLDFVRDGQIRHGYRVKPAPRRIEEFSGVIADSFRPEATFMNRLLLARFFPGGSLVVHNFAVFEVAGTGVSSRTLANVEELAAFITQRFEMPLDIVQDALADLRDLHSDLWA